jgi:hypothetical protein
MLDSLALSSLMSSPLSIAALVLGAAGALLVIAGLTALVRLRPLRFALRTLAGVALLSIAGVAGALVLGIHGYRALTREDVAARLSVRPTGPQTFAATVSYADGRQAGFTLTGDEIYVDARILKWKPIANVFGLHTAYELDRVAGRYRDIEQERNAQRTVYPLGEEKPVDLFALRRRYAFLAPLLDAEYGSASFVPVTEPAVLELRVSPTGLLIREAPPAPKP